MNGRAIQGNLAGQENVPEGFSAQLIPPRIRYFSPLRFGGKDQGSLLIYGSFQFWSPLLHTLLAAATCALIFLMFRSLMTSLVQMTEEQAIRPLTRLMSAMERFSKSGRLDKLELGAERMASEVRDVALGFNAMAETIEAYSLRESAAAAILAKRDLAAQVAHDIRSPLATLRLGLDELKEVPPAKLQITRQAIERISDITHQLLVAYRRENPVEAVDARPAHELEPRLLATSLEEVLAEKRVQLRARLNLALAFRVEADDYALFARIDPVELKRIVSNLIDNSVQAIESSGEVRARLTAEPGGARVAIIVEDTGHGIDGSLLGKVGEKGFSHGKIGGSGLGIHHARATVARWEGSLTIESPIEAGRGTRVTIRLPSCPRPEWFAPGIDLGGVQDIFVVDDDESIHQLWRQRLDAVARELRIRVEYVFSAEALRKAHAARAKAASALYLVDYELARGGENGVTLIESLRIGPQSFLVTSHSDEPEIQRKSGELGFQIIPKAFAAWIPIRAGQRSD